jgi:hypothetical protein
VVDPGKVEKEVGVMAISLPPVSSSIRLQQILLVAVEDF